MALKLIREGMSRYPFKGGSATRVGHTVFLRFRGTLERRIELPEEYRPPIDYAFQITGGMMDVGYDGVVNIKGIPADFKVWHTVNYPLY